jgi:uncharacterized protein YecT (DUF1311 family)
MFCVATLFSSPPAQAERPDSWYTRAMQSSIEFHVADTDMATAYIALRENLDSDEQRDKLLAYQRAWLKKRNEQYTELQSKGSAESEALQAVTDFTKSHANELAQILSSVQGTADASSQDDSNGAEHTNSAVPSEAIPPPSRISPAEEGLPSANIPVNSGPLVSATASGTPKIVATAPESPAPSESLTAKQDLTNESILKPWLTISPFLFAILLGVYFLLRRAVRRDRERKRQLEIKRQYEEIMGMLVSDTQDAHARLLKEQQKQDFLRKAKQAEKAMF